MNPVIIQAVALDRDRAMRERAAARQRAAEIRRTGAQRPRWPGPGRGPASWTARRSRRNPRAV